MLSQKRLYIRKLGIQSSAHPSPYQLAWLNNGTDIRVSKQALVAFSIGSYKDSVHCDVLPMDACHLLLGRPWQYDRDANHRGKENTYNFSFEGRTITLLPSKEINETIPSSVPPASSKPAQSLLILPKAGFEDQVRKSELIFALVTTPAIFSSYMPVPKAFEDLLKDFQDIFPENLPAELPPLRDIQHCIDLVPSAALSNESAGARRVTPPS